MAAEGMRKITLEVPVELLERAQRASKAGVTETVRAGLRELAAAAAYEALLKLPGKVSFGMSRQERSGAGRQAARRFVLAVSGSVTYARVRSLTVSGCGLAPLASRPFPRVATRQGSAVPNFARLALRSCPRLRGQLGPCRRLKGKDTRED